MKNKLIEIASEVGNSAASEISKSIGSLSGASSTWAKAWIVNKILENVAAAVVIVLVAIVCAILIYKLVIAFYKREIFHSRCLKNEILRLEERIKDFTKADISADFSEKFRALHIDLSNLKRVQNSIEFEPLKERLEQIIESYDNNLRLFYTRMQRVEAVVFKGKKDKSEAGRRNKDKAKEI